MPTQIISVDDLKQEMESLFSHKRFSLRSAAIISVFVGSLLNFVSLLVVFVGGSSPNAAKHLTAWTSVVVSQAKYSCAADFGVDFTKSSSYRSIGIW